MNNSLKKAVKKALKSTVMNMAVAGLVLGLTFGVTVESKTFGPVGDGYMPMVNWNGSGG